MQKHTTAKACGHYCIRCDISFMTGPQSLSYQSKSVQPKLQHELIEKSIHNYYSIAPGFYFSASLPIPGTIRQALVPQCTHMPYHAVSCRTVTSILLISTSILAIALPLAFAHHKQQVSICFHCLAPATGCCCPRVAPAAAAQPRPPTAPPSPCGY